MIDLQQFLHILRVKPGRQRRRTDEITKHDRELSPLGSMGRLLTCGLQPRRRKLANGVKNLPPVANRRNANLLQVGSRQAG
jgi:hypothetical protein